jgi:uncharacterized DUF497 family protein
MNDDENWDVIASRPEFEWDENKRLSNVDKHGLDFVDCLDVFLDPGAFVYLSARSETEKRYVIVGRVRQRNVSVVFTRRGSLVRLISARISRRNERRQYEAERKKRD